MGRASLFSALFAVALAGCAPARFFPELSDIKYSTSGPLVRLYYTPLSVIGFIAAHPHFIAYDGEWHRWEVWNEGDLHADGLYLYKDLFPLCHGVGAGGPIVEEEWRGEEAGRILAVLQTCKDTYPYADKYLIWPGPNSNAFAAWVLRSAGIDHDFPLRAIGSNY